MQVQGELGGSKVDGKEKREIPTVGGRAASVPKQGQASEAAGM